MIAQAAASPKMMLSGTTIARHAELRRIALQVRSTCPRWAAAFSFSDGDGSTAWLGAGT